MLKAEGLLLVAIAALSWGTTGTTLKLIGAEAPSAPLLVGALRMLIAAPALLAAAGATRRMPTRVGRGFAVAGLCMAAYQICYFSAVPLAGVPATALLAICSAPVFIAILAKVVLGERLTRARLVAMVLGLAGAGLLLAGEGPMAGKGFAAGGALALAAGLAYSVYAVVTKRALNGASPLGLSALTFSAAALALSPVVAARWPEASQLLAHGAPHLLFLGLIATAAAYWLYTTGLQRVPAGAAAVAGLLEPLTATLLGAALFGERLGATGLAGAVLLVGAVVAYGLALDSATR